MVIATVRVLYYPPPTVQVLADALLTRASGKMGMDALEMEEWERRVNDSEKNLGQCVKEKEMLTKRSGEFERRLQECEEVCNITEEELRNTVTTLNEQVNDGKIKLIENEAFIKTLENHFLQCENLTRTLASKAERASNQIPESNKTKDEMKGTIGKMSLDEKELQNKLRELQQDHTNLQSELNNAKTNLEEIPKLRKWINDLDENIKTEKEQTNAVVKQLSEREATLRECQNKNIIYEETTKKLASDTGVLEKTKSDLEGSLTNETNEKDVAVSG